MSVPTAVPPASSPPRARLESWKSIAAYLHREVNTVQRWERHEGLPVHRQAHGKAGSVFAFTDEVDAWHRQRSTVVTPSAGGAIVDPDTATTVPGMQVPARGAASESEAGTPARPPAPLAAASGRRRADERRTPPRWRSWYLPVAALAIAAAVWFGWRGQSGESTTGLGAADVRSVAVLPLRDVSAQAGEEYFADGMTEAVIARLATATNLTVTSRTSVMKFRDGTSSLPAIARALRVDAVLEGSVTRAGDRVRVIATLVDARRDVQLWSGEFERPIENVLALQGEIADAVAGAVRATVRGAGTNRDVSSASYTHYLRGRVLLDENTRTALQQAIREFDAALVADPTFAPAYAGLASAHDDLSNTIIGAAVGAGGSERSIAAATRALELDPDLAEAHSALARGLMGQLKWRQAEASFRTALDLNPSDARTHLWFGEWLAVKGTADEAVASARRALALDPLSARTMAAGAFVMGLAGAHDQALPVLRAALAMRPDYFQAEFFLGINLAAAPSTLGEAIGHMESAARLSGRSPEVLARLARLLDRAGRDEQARAIARELLARREREWIAPTAVGSAYEVVGQRDLALRELERAFAERSRGVHLLTRTSQSDALANDPRYRALMQRIVAE
ncbi:MAG: tetratricopeptide repeat protein [Acidobacteria bacterium]|nr:tetratricopeptide repeat protein [Acidobacteriota bacterium]